MAMPLTAVGYTSGVYTYTPWNTPVANALTPNKNTVSTTLEEGRRRPLLIKRILLSAYSLLHMKRRP